ncbi:alpha/beta fold hydrolase [Membranihabitans maritimus]|uniref:alpha/beta fold hydrolase n=1 Tax=Membranihabitans maritimus TaxID=2904244 RepID=UPI001F4724DB|nr:alpha/beta fold hydrolase [Membranihabitans maritimus]
MLKLNYRALGEGQPMVILHGLFGSLDNWATLGRKWSEEFNVILVDLRNHGKSPHTSSHSYPEMAEDVNRFLEEHDLFDVCLLGHSMGGKVAMQTALSFPDRLNSIIVADMAPKAYPRGHDKIFEAMNALNLNVTSRKELEEKLFEYLDDKGIVLFLSKNLKRSSTGFEWKFNKEVLEKDYEKIIRALHSSNSFTKPALFIKGEKSHYLAEEDGSIIAPLFPQYQLNIIENAGHWIHADNPNRFYNVVRQFLHKL